jgi:transposase
VLVAQLSNNTKNQAIVNQEQVKRIVSLIDKSSTAMQGRKRFLEKTRLSFKLSERVPPHNIYRRLKELLKLDFLYELTAPYYGKCGQKSIDAVVFFKLMLVAHLENISSDRKLLEHCSMRLDILYFLGYDLDEPLPFHSTLSRTRQLLGKEVFEQLFEKVFALCVEKGMVSGRKQCIDSAFVKANASLDSLLVKQEIVDQANINLQTPYRKSKVDRSKLEQRALIAKEYQLAELTSRQINWREKQKRRPGAIERSRYLSNLTHYSPTDPDAKIAVKVGKPRQLCYLASMAVDAAKGVITHIQGDFADKKDSRYLQDIVKHTKARLQRHELQMQYVLADTGYSSGENYAFLEREKLIGYIPVHGHFQIQREGFRYDKEQDCYICPNNKVLSFKRIYTDRDYYLEKIYRSSRNDCNICPMRQACLGNRVKEKKLEITYFQDQYARAYHRQHSLKGIIHKKIRQSKVEPVFGTLLNHLAMKRVNTRGQQAAHKCMLMAATVFNLKKYLTYLPKATMGIAMAASLPIKGFYCLRSMNWLSAY